MVMAILTRMTTFSQSLNFIVGGSDNAEEVDILLDLFFFDCRCQCCLSPALRGFKPTLA